VIGVMPPRFTWHVADAWVPKPIERGAAPSSSEPALVPGAPAPGRERGAGEAELQVIAERRAREHPQDYPKRFRIDVIT
jgi:hypothetical protein